MTLIATSTRPAGSKHTALITYQPTVTVTGGKRAVEVLSTARPKAPVISQVVPAWQLKGPSGSVASGGISVTRTGGFLRVYLNRPWYGSGDGELLGVVTTVTSPSDDTSTFLTTPQRSWVTMMGLDPINYVGAANTPWPVVPTSFANLAPIPVVPGRPVPYTNPPQVYLAEDERKSVPNLAVRSRIRRRHRALVRRYRAATRGDRGRHLSAATWIFHPPCAGTFPAVFHLCRGLEGGTVEVSPVVTATFAQPVPDRSVAVITDSADSTGRTLLSRSQDPPIKDGAPLPVSVTIRRNSTTPITPSLLRIRRSTATISVRPSEPSTPPPSWWRYRPKMRN